MHENDVSFRIRGCLFEVYNLLGAGLLESFYESALAREFTIQGLKFERQVGMPVVYKGISAEDCYRLDFIVEGLVAVELKAVEVLAPVHHAQLLTYLKISGLKLGLLVNFNTEDLKKSIIRKVNGLEE